MPKLSSNITPTNNHPPFTFMHQELFYANQGDVKQLEQISLWTRPTNSNLSIFHIPNHLISNFNGPFGLRESRVDLTQN